MSEGLTQETLDADKARYYGIVKMTEIIGEAAYKLTDGFVKSHPDVPWKVIRGMGHYLVHEYYQITKEGLWDTITSDVPQLRPYIVRYIEELSGKGFSQKSLDGTEHAP